MRSEPFSDDVDALARLLGTGLVALAEGRSTRNGPLPTGGPAVVSDLAPDNLLPEHGVGAVEALTSVVGSLAAGSADPTHPLCTGHLHCPPLAVAVAADSMVAALNQSLDSWDQAPLATDIERAVVRSLAGLVGYRSGAAGGVLTTGATESNLMGLLLAREVARESCREPLILCSRLAHFSVARNAALLGLDESTVVGIAVDSDHRLDPGALKDAMSKINNGGGVQIQPVIVATAGTTDFGSVDPLREVAGIAGDHEAWLHVDAAYGGGALFSDRLAGLLDGLDAADSIALDFHKLGWQPVAAGVFLTRENYSALGRNVAYLNPVDDEDAGFPSLLGLSLRTTRRADAVKLAVTLLGLGREGLGELVDRCHDLARYAASRIAEHPRLELMCPPRLTTVVFGHRSRHVNAPLRRRLLTGGKAVVGRADIDGEAWLKLTFLNPQTTHADIDHLLELVVAASQEELR